MKAKIAALAMIWISFPLTALLLIKILWLKLMLLSVACAVTLYLLYLPTAAGKGNR